MEEVKRYVIQMQAISPVPYIDKKDIAFAMTMDANARGIILESLLIEEVKE